MVNYDNHCPLTIKEWPEDERPRERLKRLGPESLTNAELLAIILRTGDASTRKTALDHAKFLLSRFKDFRTLKDATFSELCEIKGIGSAKAAQIMAAMEIAKRFSAQRIEEGSPFHCSKDVFNHFHESLRGRKKEVLISLLLDSKNRCMKEVLLSKGSLTSSTVQPREVFRVAIKEAAASLILIHNHPSGDPTPSREDMEITSRLRKVGDLLCIKVLDHIIIGNGRYISFADNGWL